MFRLITFFANLLFIINCNATDTSNLERFRSNLIAKTSSFIEKKYNVRSIGEGGRVDQDKINYIRISFDCYNVLPKNQIRNLMVNIANDFLKLVNEEKQVDNYLLTYPYPINKVFISVFFMTPDLDNVFYPNVSVSSVENGNVTYDYDDPKKPNAPYMLVETESFEEALKILQEQQKS